MVTKRFHVVCAGASVLLVAGAASSGAALAEPAVTDSTAAMLRLHIPFGGRSAAVSQASLTMNFGHRWGHSPGMVGTRQPFTPALQAGWKFTGAPVFRIGAIDAMRGFTDRANAQADEAGTSGNRRLLWIALGVVAVGATAIALSSPDDDSEYECITILPPPGTPPLQCPAP